MLVVQALFFADGGILALGCNIFNLGFFPAFIACPLIYRKIIGYDPGQTRMTVAATCAAVAGLLLGACGVMLETTESGVSALPIVPFMTFMLPIHLAIGVVEGVVTAAIISLVATARPELLLLALPPTLAAGRSLRVAAAAFLAIALLSGGFFSLFASERPDGLEWSIDRTTGGKELKMEEEGVHGAVAALQEKLAFLPGYTFRRAAATEEESLNRNDKAVQGGGKRLRVRWGPVWRGSSEG